MAAALIASPASVAPAPRTVGASGASTPSAWRRRDHRASAIVASASAVSAATKNTADAFVKKASSAHAPAAQPQRARSCALT
jgi:hypothetical protein